MVGGDEWVQPVPTVRITRGPRWDRLIVELQRSIVDLESFDGRLDVATMMLEVHRSALQYARAARPIEPHHLVHWVKGGPWDSNEPVPDRLNDALSGDSAIRCVDQAERFLTEAAETRVFLMDARAPDDKARALVPPAAVALSRLVAALANGEFVTRDLYDEWRSPLREFGSEWLELWSLLIDPRRTRERRAKYSFTNHEDVFDAQPSGTWWRVPIFFNNVYRSFVQTDERAS